MSRLKLGLILFSLVIVGCAGPGIRPQNQNVTKLSEDLKQTTLKLPVYRMQIGDRLSIKFFYNAELNEEMVIRPDGKISLQLIDDIEALDKTPARLTRDIKEKYKNILKRPEVTVIVKQFAGQKVYIGGEIGRPGLIQMDSPLTVLQAIFQSGGYLNTASSRDIILIRRTPGNQPKIYKLDLEKPSNDVFLQSYDMVFVSKSAIASADLFIEQYIDKLIPFSRSVGFSYVYDLQVQ